ncbi:MAG: hypothetical protein R2695_10875 [Acidimicrobiales bacterium]
MTAAFPWGRPPQAPEGADVHGVVGRVVRVDRGECDVVTDEGRVRVFSDSQRAQDEIAPVTGDWVVVADEEGLGPVVAAVLDRWSSISRQDPAERDVEQVLAANIDIVAVVHGLDRPLPPAGSNGCSSSPTTAAPNHSWC